MRSRIACAPGAPDAGVAELHRGGREDVSRETARMRVRSREWFRSCGSMHSNRLYTGRMTLNLLPLPTSLCTSTLPPWDSTMPRTMLRPRPLPDTPFFFLPLTR